jgi:hypothetical protein
MAGTKNGAAIAAPKEETASLPAVQESGAVPAYLNQYRGATGAENIDTTDITIPRIKVAQGTSEEVKAGLMKEGDLFLNITGEVLAPAGQALRVIPIHISKEFILWNDLKDGGGILARANREPGSSNYAWDKPYTDFEVKLDGKLKVKWSTKKYCGTDKNSPDPELVDTLGAWGSEIPDDAESKIAATAHHNYVVSLPDFGDLVAAFSLSRSGAKRARDFNAMLNLSDAPIFSRVFAVTTENETNKQKQIYKNVRFRPAGFVQTEESFKKYQTFAKRFSTLRYTVDQSDGDAGADAAESDGKF